MRQESRKQAILVLEMEITIVLGIVTSKPKWRSFINGMDLDNSDKKTEVIQYP